MTERSFFKKHIWLNIKIVFHLIYYYYDSREFQFNTRISKKNLNTVLSYEILMLKFF